MAVDTISSIFTPTISTDETTFSVSVNLVTQYLYKHHDFDSMDFDLTFDWGSNSANANRPTYQHNHGQGTTDSHTFNISRKAFFPCSNKTIKEIDVWVRGAYKNWYQGGWTKWYRSPTLRLEPPKAPEVSFDFETVDNEKYLKITITADEGAYNRERYDTVASVGIWKHSTTTDEALSKTIIKLDMGTDDSFTWRKKVSEIESMNSFNSLNEFIYLSVSAYSRGLAGESAWAEKSWRMFSRPNVPTINGIRVSSEDTVIVSCSSNADDDHPVQTLTLERLVGTEYGDAARVALETDWDEVATGGETTTALCDLLTDATPTEKGTHTWYRLVSAYDDYTRRSLPVEFTAVYQPPMTIDLGTPFIFNAASGDNGTSVVIDVAWPDDTVLNLDAEELKNFIRTTQITWGEDEYSWHSTDGVSEFDFDWEDTALLTEANAAPGSEHDYAHAGRVWITGLTEGEDCFVRARRKLESDDETKYGDWSNTVKVIPVSSPSWVRLSAPSYIARGESLPLTWTLGTEAMQTGWVLTDAAGIGIADGNDASGYALIPAEALENIEVLSVRVSATTGGAWISSDLVDVRIVDAPTCSVSCQEVLASYPLKLDIEASDDSSVALSIVSRGVTYTLPDGEHTQYADDVIYAAEVNSGEVSIDDIGLLMGCTYDVIVRAKDRTTGLLSEQASACFAVAWQRLADVPDATITPNDEARTVAITTIAPEDVVAGDVCDIYRVTSDQSYLIASGVAFGSTVTDRFAPFCSAGMNIMQSYRIACRTPEGNVAWRDVEYSLAADGLRFDWDRSHIELPYNIKLSENVDKDVDIRKHLDGTTNAYWNRGVKRGATATTDMIRFESNDQRRLIRELSHYGGAVFVRVPNGLAFEADVQLDDIEESYDSGVVAVSLKITEIGLTADHMCSEDDIVEAVHD